MIKWFLVVCAVCVSLFTTVEAETICLNMIVKNEKNVICRCLESVSPLIDTWVIVDTGSTDGTQDVIRNFMKEKGIPGELHERPWKNFAHNRTEAIDLAKGKADYFLIIDADDDLVYSDQFSLPRPLEKDAYHIKISHGGMVYSRPQLIKASLPWRWVGVLHEYLDCQQPQQSIALLDGVTMRYGGDGARSRDPEKFRKDADVLEAAIKEEPTNSRYVFYLAQSYRDGGVLDKALSNYQKRVALGGWDQEVYYSMLQVARLQQRLGLDPSVWIDSFYRAYLFRPSRSEALYDLVRYHRISGDHYAGYLLSKKGLTTALPADVLFVEKWIYDWGLLMEYSICAAWIGEHEEAQASSYLLLSNADLPQDVRTCVENNIRWITAQQSQARANSVAATQWRQKTKGAATEAAVVR